jgi:hypothetical protein
MLFGFTEGGCRRRKDGAGVFRAGAEGVEDEVGGDLAGEGRKREGRGKEEGRKREGRGKEREGRGKEREGEEEGGSEKGERVREGKG